MNLSSCNAMYTFPICTVVYCMFIDCTGKFSNQTQYSNQLSLNKIDKSYSRKKYWAPEVLVSQSLNQNNLRLVYTCIETSKMIMHLFVQKDVLLIDICVCVCVWGGGCFHKQEMKSYIGYIP